MANYDNLIKAGIDMESLLKRLMGNASLVSVFIKKFLQDKTFEELKTAFLNNDIKQAEFKSHTLKGMCGNLSINELYELFSEQTNLIRSNEFEKAQNMMPYITDLYNKTIFQMTLWIEEK